MTSISYLYSSPDLINYFKETIKNIETVVSQMEEETVEDNPTKDRRAIDLANAVQIKQIQEQIASYCAKRHVLDSLVPDALVIWNICRVRLGRDPIRIASWAPTTASSTPSMGSLATKK
ncbi:uncharacterized protein PGTG_07641 [Puccinia graminis f. sp. tritici CRL 75-36-700-3]|uniref:Uncharacterized protein n=1 Tax=Puccinia graminis f. sp. tritici (strain CRL 75-36-700-3 / race SCCL) TaxID=418459 RepID=E3KCV8_PUCGT|nr:uncharacterized protein PGTG_07641 [Puccinia graminis f. sp. tritici CRL 75-36-700-3]EFP82244.1 hypothetical protein PGTG_07641 [Puccinia graminis f. sp. tritici CRL 75-36-700-3]